MEKKDLLLKIAEPLNMRASAGNLCKKPIKTLDSPFKVVYKS